MVRAQLQNVLNIVTLSSHGKEVKVDGFKLLSDQTYDHPLYEQSRPPAENLSPESLDCSILYEPRIQLIKKQIESLLSVIDLEHHGKIAQVDGFRLKDLRDWVLPSDCDPSEILEIAASRCDCDCLMCYNKGNPPSLALRANRRSPAEELNEIKTRLNYFSPSKGERLFPSLGCSYEVIESRKAEDVLFLSSTLVKPVFEQCLRESHLLSSSNLKISIRVPRNNYLGGNVFMGDLFVVQDFIDCIKEYLSETEKEPDLIVMPSSPFSLGGWGRDLTGRVYLDIEREIGIPVELLTCETIYD